MVLGGAIITIIIITIIVIRTIVNVLAGTIFFSALLSCCSIWKELRCLTVSLALVLVILLVAQIAAGITGYVLREDLDSQVFIIISIDSIIIKIIVNQVLLS